MSGLKLAAEAANEDIKDEVKYRYDKDVLLRKHDSQLVYLQIQHLEELKALARAHNDVVMSDYYEGMIASRKNIQTH